MYLKIQVTNKNAEYWSSEKYIHVFSFSKTIQLGDALLSYSEHLQL